MPAIVDPDGPGGKPDLDLRVRRHSAISWPARPASSIRATSAGRVEVDQWLFWQMGGVGPMAGQVHHFKNYAGETLTYAINRYVNEVNRLYGVMNLALKDREFIAGRYSIADMALVGWRQRLGAAGPGHQSVSQSQALARNRESAARGQTRHGARARVAPGHRYEGSESSRRCCSDSGRERGEGGCKPQANCCLSSPGLSR